MEYQQTIWIAADDGEDGGCYTVEIVTLPRGAADAVVLNIQKESCVVGEAADAHLLERTDDGCLGPQPKTSS